MHLVIASDHAGFKLKELFKKELLSKGHTVDDLGPSTADRTDYPDFAHKLARDIAAHAHEFGVLVCGSGIGMAMAANRHKGVRAAVINNEEEARLSREHNNANVACFGERALSPEEAVRFLQIFLDTPFSGGRHAIRVQKIELT
ncbi:MAG: ribose 5-phosphate isomerase B [Deltaproteobacteria bacterium CG_4_10_14_0_2_um_filter_43_8]|nr:MAG: ribose 5-phosphate isomerase B [Deltaproteobacteria bacterium CG11_big_fil_rev_8_21_14_0_20_42_23]PJA22322.1 MAG: ribose 5-phosphate isomerase B [Deltaproteobacteria bacterium CG_4_10_14_0_2_um_filter_43_8]PJC64280.1 MAG: ribose 5-phosphate isomerase B [Deltaproteobacteria bacterium CG_4_9_14_0_2_um_filter_42_21]